MEGCKEVWELVFWDIRVLDTTFWSRYPSRMVFRSPLANTLVMLLSTSSWTHAPHSWYLNSHYPSVCRFQYKHGGIPGKSNHMQ